MLTFRTGMIIGGYEAYPLYLSGMAYQFFDKLIPAERATIQ
jgi:hypothetical protein